MTSNQGQQRRPQTPCTQCGGTTFIWGRTRGQDAQQFLVNPHPGASMRDKLYPTRVETEARMCKSCFNIQVYGVVPDQDARLRTLLGL